MLGNFCKDTVMGTHKDRHLQHRLGICGAVARESRAGVKVEVGCGKKLKHPESSE